MTIEFEITTPERTVYKELVDLITLPTTTGEITILPNHMPLVSELMPGELRVVKGNDTTIMAVASGYVEVRTGNRVIILADAADRAEELDEAEVEEAQWNNPHELKQRYPKASILGKLRVVFNLCWNKYRLLAIINYKNKIVLVEKIGTHKEYNKWDIN